MTVTMVISIAFALWGLVIPGAIIGLRLRRAAAAERLRPAPRRACERRARSSAPRRLVTRAH